MSDKVNASQAAQRLARSAKLDIGEITATGSGGQVTKPDVEKAIAAKQKPPADPPAVEPDAAAAAAAAAETAAADNAGDGDQEQEPAVDPDPPAAKKGKRETLPITKLRDDLSVTWWCPFDDFSMPGEHYQCGRCGATRDGGATAALGDKVTAA